MTTTSPEVTIELQRDSLYIMAETIPSANLEDFHWVIICTDAMANATSHEWVEVEGEGLAKRYIRGTPPGTTVAGLFALTPSPSTISLFRVNGFIPPSSADLDQQEFEAQFFENVFSETFSTVNDNRAHGITSCTWVWRVLGAMKDCGFIYRQGTIDDLAVRVTEASVEQQKSRRALDSGRSLQPPIIDI
ncbi:hypothetical protein BD410DRAFT_902526 [Rickenella mellea]|uniref:Uncharacterized protein n=1 Tax=Rickenella mellea TaxID=50990 RepID=A0A4Y7PK45_9AGAM|nr:hypothetical protein BD410DRAFT_902526 [Rickenella mellea]